MDNPHSTSKIDFATLLRGPLTDRIVNENETATYLGLSTRTLRAQRAKGTGPAWVMLSEKRIGYRVSDLNAFIKANRVHPVARPRD